MSENMRVSRVPAFSLIGDPVCLQLKKSAMAWLSSVSTREQAVRAVKSISRCDATYRAAIYPVHLTSFSGPIETIILNNTETIDPDEPDLHRSDNLDSISESFG